MASGIIGWTGAIRSIQPQCSNGPLCSSHSPALPAGVFLERLPTLEPPRPYRAELKQLLQRRIWEGHMFLPCCWMLPPSPGTHQSSWKCCAPPCRCHQPNCKTKDRKHWLADAGGRIISASATNTALLMLLPKLWLLHRAVFSRLR